MKSTDFDPIVRSEASAMAEAINGGKWSTHYTEPQRVGWCQKVEWAMQRYCGLALQDVIVMHGDNRHTL